MVTCHALYSGLLICMSVFNISFLTPLLGQQVPEEFERVMAGVEAYMSIRKSIYGGNSSVLGFYGESGKKDFPQVCVGLS